MCYVCLGPVSFCTWEEYWPLINLSGSPRGYQQFNAVATPCCVDMADCHRCCCTYKWCDKSLLLKFNYSSSVQYTTHSLNWLFCWLSAINSLESFCSMNRDACWSNINRLMNPVFKIKKQKPSVNSIYLTHTLWLCTPSNIICTSQIFLAPLQVVTRKGGQLHNSPCPHARAVPTGCPLHYR